MKKHILILGAGFGGLELSTTLSEAFGDGVDVTLIDKGDAFTFGYSKLDVMFGRTTLDAVRLPYKNFVKPGVRPPWRARRGWVRFFPRSPRATFSSASAGHRSNARRHPAKRR